MAPVSIRYHFAMARTDTPPAELIARARNLDWYHTLELAPGPGHRRAGSTCARTSPLRAARAAWRACAPSRSAPGTASGRSRWSAAGAEVVALDLDDERDLDWPPRRRPTTFPRQAARAKASGSPGRCSARTSSASTARSTTRRPRSSGTFDLVFCGSVLIHLRDQLLALERIAEPLQAGDLHLRRGVRPPQPPGPVPRLALPRRPRLGRRLLAAVRAHVEADAVDRGLRPGRGAGPVQDAVARRLVGPPHRAPRSQARRMMP